MVAGVREPKKTGARRGRPPVQPPREKAKLSEVIWPREGMGMITEVAQFFRCSRSTVTKMIDDGRIEAVLVGSDRRVNWASVWRYVDAANGRAKNE